jgi:putative ABC transport system substrate-binding protein
LGGGHEQSELDRARRLAGRDVGIGVLLDMTSRRDLLALAASSVLPLAARAQGAKKPFKVAWFSGGVLEDQKVYVEAFQRGMRELGWVEGRDFAIQYFWRGETIKPFGWIAKDIAASNPDVIMATCEVTVEAAKAVTGTIPIVMTASTDPVAAGVVPSLARPGGNVTGMSSTLVEVSVKRIELLKELLPSAERVAFVRWKYETVSPTELKKIVDTAQGLKLGFKVFEAEDEGDFRRIFAEIQKQKFAGAIDVAGLSIAFPYVSLFPELEVRFRIPIVHFLREMVERGGLISYGPSVADAFRRSAAYVDRIAKGARPGDLPIEQPTQLEMWVNLKTARAIGLNVPQSVLLRADRVIE